MEAAVSSRVSRRRRIEVAAPVCNAGVSGALRAAFGLPGELPSDMARYLDRLARCD